MTHSMFDGSLSHFCALSLPVSVQVFHDIAYKAKDRQDLLAGIDEFLDEVIVLPPGEWDPAIRIEPPKSLPSSDKRSRPFCFALPHIPAPLNTLKKPTKFFDCKRSRVVDWQSTHAALIWCLHTVSLYRLLKGDHRNENSSPEV